MDEEFDTVLAKQAQKEYCKSNGYPMFAPNNGICYSCGRNIYHKVVYHSGNVGGISVKKAGSTLITGCPFCNRSYVD